jgi:hypothetical protein
MGWMTLSNRQYTEEYHISLLDDAEFSLNYIISYEYVTSGLDELPFENAFKALALPKTKSD